jgi:CheY-like chemotaxis protein
LNCDSDLGSGSVFIFNFPVDKIPLEEKKEKSMATPEVAEKRLKKRYNADLKKTKVILSKEVPETIEEDVLGEDNSSIVIMSSSVATGGDPEVIDRVELTGRIIVAEDQHINVEVLRSYLGDLNIHSECDFCIDGQLAIDCAKSLIDKACDENETRPICLMLLDLQMPNKNGIQVVTEVREYFKLRVGEGFKLEEPEFVFLTAFKNLGLQNHLK